jgi:DNA modification methylase
MEIQKISIDKLKPAKYNPRKNLKPGDPEYEKIKRSIQEFGYVEPIIWNKRTGNVVGGHQRLKIFNELGEKEIDCVIVDMDETREKALNIALNKISGQWDTPLLKDLLQELDTGAFDMALTGFDVRELEELMNQYRVEDIKEDNFDVDKALEDIKEPITKRRDIWQLGRHRLMCGDSTIITDVEKLMGGVQADMVFTDPPYNVNYEGATKEKLKIQNDSMNDSKFYQFLYDAYVSMYSAVKAGGAIYVCHSDTEGLNFRKALKDSGWLLKQCIVWVKNSIVMGRQDHHWQHEPILYGWKPGASHKWYGGRKQSTVIKSEDGVFVNKTDKGFQLTFNNGAIKVVLNVPEYDVIEVASDEVTTIWYIDKPLRSGEHPTMKPIKLCARAINNSSISDSIVLDVFGGSGSTLIAAEQLNRICYMMELDEKYCDVIIQRWEKFTNKKAELIKDD